jgi:plasmid maintenance system killer protein|tara:strand:+ start:244 stop:462 length:219 start_codon:yes stop_codon:yes gene_type:complete
MLLLLLLLFRNGNIFFFGDERMSRYIRLSLEKRISLRINLLNASRKEKAAHPFKKRYASSSILFRAEKYLPN